MLGVIYLVICFLSGYGICTIAFPKSSKITNHSFDGSQLHLSPYFILLPAWFITGTLVITWMTYIISYFFRSFEKPLLYGNSIVITIVLVIAIVMLFQKKSKENQNRNIKVIEKENKLTKGEVLFLILVITLSISLMWTTFYMKGSNLYIGVSVFSDFSPHIGMIRSFSVGNNFPTSYSHFAGEDIRYHFMFQFLVGNLEFLGLPIDYAFNIPSILSFIFTFLLLYVLSVKITKKRTAGYLASLFFAFRSSKSLFTYLASLPKGSILKTLRSNTEFIGYTPNENWGLWNLNVYANQRHLALSLCVMLFVIIVMLPGVYQMYGFIKTKYDKLDNYAMKNRISKIRVGKKEGISQCFLDFMFHKDGWMLRDKKKAISLGILLGMIAFWNGAAFVATILILFFMAIVSSYRLEYLVIAIIAGILSLLQSSFFIKGSAISPSYFFGFIAENKTFFGVMEYIEELFGILVVVLLFVFLVEKGVKKYLILIFITPIIFAFTISLTVDVTVNHKYIMMGVMLVGIFVADKITDWYKKKDIFIKFSCILLCVILTGTGVYDFLTYINRNLSYDAIKLDTKDEITTWIIENTDSKDIFLTSNYALNQVVLGGAMLYYGWPYYAWSAGYNTDFRMEQMKSIYEADSSEKLTELIEANNINYIIIDGDNRFSEDYQLNEENIKNTYALVYEDGAGSLKRSIYDTSKRIR
jgi:hypothetical protein